MSAGMHEIARYTLAACVGFQIAMLLHAIEFYMRTLSRNDLHDPAHRYAIGQTIKEAVLLTLYLSFFILSFVL